MKINRFYGAAGAIYDISSFQNDSIRNQNENFLTRIRKVAALIFGVGVIAIIPALTQNFTWYKGIRVLIPLAMSGILMLSAKIGEKYNRRNSDRTGLQIRSGNAPVPQIRSGNAPAPQVRSGNVPVPQVQSGNAPAPQVRSGNVPVPQVQSQNVVSVSKDDQNIPEAVISSFSSENSGEVLRYMKKNVKCEDLLKIIFLYVGKKATEAIKPCCKNWETITESSDFIFRRTCMTFNNNIKNISYLFGKSGDSYFFIRYIRETEKKEGYNSNLVLEILNTGLPKLNNKNKLKVFKKMFNYIEDDENYSLIISKILCFMKEFSMVDLEFVEAILERSKKFNKYKGLIDKHLCDLIGLLKNKKVLFEFIKKNKGPYFLLDRVPKNLLKAEPTTYEEVVLAMQEVMDLFKFLLLDPGK